MDDELVRRWNSVVGPDDEVWHLGDFAYRCGPNRLLDIFSRLQGRAIHLVSGNHDRKHTLALPWASIQQYAELQVEGQAIVLFHYALRVWNRCHHGAWNLYGHSHGRLNGSSTSCDVGVDAWSYTPASLEQIAERLKKGGDVVS